MAGGSPANRGGGSHATKLPSATAANRHGPPGQFVSVARRFDDGYTSRALASISARSRAARPYLFQEAVEGKPLIKFHCHTGGAWKRYGPTVPQIVRKIARIIFRPIRPSRTIMGA